MGATRPRSVASKRGGETKARGGYVRIPAAILVAAFGLYTDGDLTLLDLRTFLALHEVAARRTFLGEGRSPKFELPELMKLLGARRDRVREALSHLKLLGLASFSESGVFTASSVSDLFLEPDRKQGLETGGDSRISARLVPFPRPLLRYLVGGVTKVRAAVIFSHLIRCVFVKKGELSAIGNCSATLVEETFGISAGRARKERAALIRLGLFAEVSAPQWHKNRYGSRIAVNLAWDPKQAAKARLMRKLSTRQSARPSPVIHPLPGPALEKTDLPTEGKNQNPVAPPQTQPPVHPATSGARADLTGACAKQGGEGTPSKTRAEGRPTLKHLESCDLERTERLLVLHQHACSAGLASKSEAGELAFVALAEHAKRYGTRNPPGLFMALLKRQAFHFITGDDEDQARTRLIELRERSTHRVGDGRGERAAREEFTIRPGLTVNVPRRIKEASPIGNILQGLVGQIRPGMGVSHLLVGGGQ